MTKKQHPFSIKLFLPEADPEGLRFIGKSHWTGQGIVFSRTGFPDAAQRYQEFKKVGVYVLVGDEPGSALPTVYIGQTGDISRRIREHFDKDFWTWGVFFISTDNSINKAHAIHIEDALIKKAKDFGKCNIDQSDGSSMPLSMADKADAESFLQDMLDIFPIAGLSVFEETVAPDQQPEVVVSLKSKGVTASGYEKGGKFVVEKGSQAVLDNKVVKSTSSRAVELRKDLTNQKILKKDGSRYIFTKDYEFNSPSLAAGVVLGLSTNGRTTWTDENDTSLKELATRYATSEE